MLLRPTAPRCVLPDALSPPFSMKFASWTFPPDRAPPIRRSSRPSRARAPMPRREGGATGNVRLRPDRRGRAVPLPGAGSALPSTSTFRLSRRSTTSGAWPRQRGLRRGAATWHAASRLTIMSTRRHRCGRRSQARVAQQEAFAAVPQTHSEIGRTREGGSSPASFRRQETREPRAYFDLFMARPATCCRRTP
jgi:hypothetical protein